MVTDSDPLASDSDSTQSKHIRHVLYFELILEHMLFSFVNHLLATRGTVLHGVFVIGTTLKSGSVCDPQLFSVCWTYTNSTHWTQLWTLNSELNSHRHSLKSHTNALPPETWTISPPPTVPHVKHFCAIKNVLHTGEWACTNHLE